MSIEAKNIKYTYSIKSPFEKTALEDITFTINKGETVGIIGSTGSGKSTLVQHFNALIKLMSGSLVVSGIDLSSKRIPLKELRSKIGMLFQYPEYQLFEDTVIKDVSFGPLNFGYSKENAQRASEVALELVGLELNEVKSKSPFELSGGEQRRVAIAGVIASKPEILVLDEPTSGLDPLGKRAILDLIMELKKSFCDTVIMISHNMDEIAEYCDRLLVLNEGKLIFDGTPKDFFGDLKNLENTGLKIPHTVEIRELLKIKDVELDSPCININELVNSILSNDFLKKKNNEKIDLLAKKDILGLDKSSNREDINGA